VTLRCYPLPPPSRLNPASEWPMAGSSQTHPDLGHKSLPASS